MHFLHTQPAIAVPENACDCHMHVFGTQDLYPFAEQRSYTPPEASLADYRAMTEAIGITRNVFVQASVYGTDNRCLVDALSNSDGQARGVAGIDTAVTDDALRTLTAAGVRGARVNAASSGGRSIDRIARDIEETAERIKPFGWHLQVFANLESLAELAPLLQRLDVPLVIDHMGLAKAALGLAQPGFRQLLALVADGAWIKVSGAYRVSEAAPDYPDVAPIACALIQANPDRILWGSDWPHTGEHPNVRLDDPPRIEFRPLDDGNLISLLGDWVDDDVTLKRILVDNPEALYGFES
jgi:2-pyrone-4,6-dicarboxylate lactonase